MRRPKFSSQSWVKVTSTTKRGWKIFTCSNWRSRDSSARRASWTKLYPTQRTSGKLQNMNNCLHPGSTSGFFMSNLHTFKWKNVLWMYSVIFYTLSAACLYQTRTIPSAERAVEGEDEKQCPVGTEKTHQHSQMEMSGGGTIVIWLLCRRKETLTEDWLLLFINLPGQWSRKIWTHHEDSVITKATDCKKPGVRGTWTPSTGVHTNTLS